MSAVTRSGLKRWEGKLTTDLNFVLTEAVPACYDNISFDMTKAPATPLSVQVAACDAKARAISTDLPPADLQTAGGRFAINSKWQSLAPASVVGAPATRRICTGRPPGPTFCFDQEIVDSVGPERVGLYQEFRTGRIFWHPDVESGAHEVHGAILDRYKLLGHADSFLGFPVSDELTLRSVDERACSSSARSTGTRQLEPTRSMATSTASGPAWAMKAACWAIPPAMR